MSGLATGGIGQGTVAQEAASVDHIELSHGEIPISPPDPRIEILQSDISNSIAQERAYADIFNALHGPLIGYAASLLGGNTAAIGPRDPEDIVQEAFLKMYRSLGAFENRGERAFTKWMYTITRNLVLNTVRDEARHVRHAATIAAEDVEPSATPSASNHIGEPGAVLAFQEELGVLGELAPRQRRAMIHRFHGLSYKEIASVEGTTVPAVKNLLAHGRSRGARLIRELEYFRAPEDGISAAA